MTRPQLYGYISYDGEYTILPQYRYADNFSDGLAVVSNSWNQQEFKYEYFYYINKQGSQAIEEKFVLASHFFKGVGHVKLMWGKKRGNANSSDGESAFAYINTSGTKIFTYWGEK